MSDANDNNLTSVQGSKDLDTTKTVDPSNGSTKQEENQGTSSAGLSSTSSGTTPADDCHKEGKKLNGFCQYSRIVIIGALLFVIAQVIQTHSFRKTQQRILDSYTVIENTNLQLIDLNDDSFSIYAEALGLSEYEKQSLIFLINDVVYKAISRIREKGSQNNDVQELLTETKGIVDMQLARIKQEYEAMQIWYGILTVVFLLFSFFSLYKTDEMISRSERLLSTIESSNDDVQKKALSMKETIDKTIKEAEVEIRNNQKSIQNSMVESNQELINNFKRSLSSEMERETDDYHQTYDALKRKVDALSHAVDHYKSIVDRMIGI